MVCLDGIDAAIGIGDVDDVGGGWDDWE